MRRALVVAAIVSACATRQRSPTPLVWERRVSVSRDRLTVTTCFDPERCEERDHPFSHRASETLTLRNSEWLPHPSPWRPELVVRTRFELPEGWDVSTAWPRSNGVYLMDATATEWEGYTLVGPLAREEITLEGTVFDVTREGFSEGSSPRVDRWLGEAWSAARSLVPAASPPRVQVLLRATERGGDAVRFGLVSRGGGPSVMFFIARDATENELARDWQATHELVHVVHPVFIDADAWLREGLATWYQEVLRARRGAITPETAWTTLCDGLTRAALEGSGATLAEESASMTRTRRYHRVYWWGVAVVLALDVRIRERSHGRASLDTALRSLYEASQRAPTRAWCARDAVSVFERATGVSLWTEVVAPALASREFVAVEATLESLGIRRDPRGAVSLSATSPRGEIRDAIMRGR